MFPGTYHLSLYKVPAWITGARKGILHFPQYLVLVFWMGVRFHSLRFESQKYRPSSYHFCCFYAAKMSSQPDSSLSLSFPTSLLSADQAGSTFEVSSIPACPLLPPCSIPLPHVAWITIAASKLVPLLLPLTQHSS